MNNTTFKDHIYVTASGILIYQSVLGKKLVKREKVQELLFRRSRLSYIHSNSHASTLIIQFNIYLLDISFHSLYLWALVFRTLKWWDKIP